MHSFTAILLGTLSAITLVNADEVAALGKQKPKPENPYCATTPPKHSRISARYTSPKGVGYNEGYTTLEGFFAPATIVGDKWLPFVDIRGHLFDNGKWASNSGLGVRHMGSSRIWGVNAYYDYRNTHRHRYSQVAVGLESLGIVWDFRLNGYIPVGKNHSSLYHPQFKTFKDHYLYLRSSQQFGMQGANAEVGVHVDHFKKAPLYFAAGPYYLTGKGATTWGGELRGSVGLFKITSD